MVKQLTVSNLINILFFCWINFLRKEKRNYLNDNGRIYLNNFEMKYIQIDDLKWKWLTFFMIDLKC